MTPMMQQYKEIKSQHPDCFLFFRLGDFYELFFDDALKASTLLNITLTRRGRDDAEEIPMCGVPFHAADTYIARLVKEGHSVALCDQVEDVSEAKKRGAKAVVKRAVVRIITPGTLTEDNLLDSKSHNFLMAFYADVQGMMGVSVIDISTGLVLVDSYERAEIGQALYRFRPREIITTSEIFKKFLEQESLKEWVSRVKTLPDARWNVSNALLRLESAYQVTTLQGLIALENVEAQSLGVLLDYVSLTQVGALPRLNLPKKMKASKLLDIDAATQRNLELFSTLGGEYEKSLLYYLDETLTAGGGRLIRLYLASPLSEASAIAERLSHVDHFYTHSNTLDVVRARLKTFPDLDRSLSRLSLGRGSPRDLAVIRDALDHVQWLKEELYDQEMPDKTRALFEHSDVLQFLNSCLSEALSENLPLLVRDGGFIKEGYSVELDEVRVLRDQGRQKIAEVQAHYIQALGVSSLKIKHNNVLGYHIEVTNTHLGKIPDYFIHRQTTANTARFTTVELTDLEQRLNEAADQALLIECALFEKLLAQILEQGASLSQLSQRMALLDVMSTFAFLAHRYDYVRPFIDESRAFRISGGRHPVVERVFQNEDDKSFKSNDCCLENEKLLWLITGPNMAGKSTFLRQNALIVVMGQMGSYVPAKAAHFGVVDRLFSRVGASDDLARGQSTFMVEMIETAMILNNATDRSLVILDEVGRGTSTHDGLSIAWAVIEHLHNHLRCRGLFATHYHELTMLHTQLKHLYCATMRVKEWQNKVIFMHEMIEGVADKSYGLHVAEMAGVPKIVVARAYELLKKLAATPNVKNASLELPLFTQISEAPKVVNPCVDLGFEKDINELCLDSLTPKQALDFLYDLKQRLHKKGVA